MKKLLNLVILFLIINQLFASKQGAELIDSIKYKIKVTPADTVRVELLGKLSFQYFSFNTDSGIHYGEMARELASKLHWGKGVAFSCNYIGTNYAVKGNYPEALDNFFKALAEYTRIGDQQGIAFTSNNLGNFYRIRKDYTLAAEYINKAIAKNSALNNYLDLSKNYNNIGIVYFQLSDYSRSDSSYQKALVLAERIRNKRMVAEVLINLSELRLKINDVCGALELAIKAASISKELAIPYDGAVHNSYIGEIYLKIADENIKNVDNCKYFTDKKTDNLLNARDFLLRSLELLKSVNDQSLISDNARLISSVFEKLGDTKSALDYYKKFLTSKDSVDSKDNNLKLANIEKNREVFLKDNQIKIQNLEIEHQHSQIKFQVVLFLLILVTITLLSYFYYKRITASTLRASEEKYRRIFENLLDIFYQINLDGIIIDVSPSIERFSEYTRDEVIGSSVFDYYSQPDDRIEFLNRILVSGELRDWELKFKTKSGEKYTSINARIIRDLNGNALYINGSMRDITERKMAEAELKESKDKYYKDLNLLTSIFESPVNIIMFALDTNYCYTSFTKFHKKTIKMIWNVDIQKGMNMLDVISNEDDRKKAKHNFDRALHGENFIETEEYGNDKFKRSFYEDYYSSIIGSDGTITGVSVFVIDISHRIQAEYQIKLLSKAIEQSPVAVVITATDGTIEYVNPNFTKVTGYAAEEVIGRNPRLLKSGMQSVEFYKDLWNTILTGKNWMGEMCNRKKNGEFYDETVLISPIMSSSGSISHFVAVKTDVSENNKMVKELITAKEKAEESDKLKTAFLNNISHEIRTPFNGILGFLSVLRADDLEVSERNEFIQLIDQSAERLMNTINDIVEISQIQAGQISLHLSEVNLNRLIQELSDQFKMSAEVKGLEIIFINNLSDVQLSVITDRPKLLSILSNLIRNAIKFTFTGTIEVRIKEVGGFIEFTVKDTGIGIPSEKQSTIFEKFIQADVSTTRRFEGAGLGLSISKSYAGMLGSEIHIESEVGKGSLFSFSLQLPQKRDETVSFTRDFTNQQTGIEIKKLTILIAEDDDPSAILIRMAVKNYSDNILRVSNGIEAVEACRKDSGIDLVLMDIKMPELDGYAAVRQIRQFNSKVIIIAQTAFAFGYDREQAIEAGCNDHLSKPIKIEKLIALIQKYFDNSIV